MRRVVVPGAAGKMGRAIVQVLSATEESRLVGAVERAGSPAVGSDAGALSGIAPLGVTVGDSLPSALAAGADVVIDFTAPAATAAQAQAAVAAGVALVVGTTGLGVAEHEAVRRAAERVPVVLSPNMSVGVNVLFDLITAAAKSLGEGFDLEVVEFHHRQKRDAPSGTAMRMAEVLATATNRDLGECGVFGRYGETGTRRPSEIGVMTVRGGDVVGDHTAYFLGLGERLEITHRASSRETFARGAVRAALWLAGRKPGLYDMQDVLGLRR